MAVVYRLIDPRTDETFYVGKSKNAGRRLYQHLNLKGLTFYTTLWICNIQSQGLKPKLEVLEECSEELVLDRERYWIEQGIENKWPLTNTVWLNQYIKKKSGIKGLMAHQRAISERFINYEPN